MPAQGLAATSHCLLYQPQAILWLKQILTSQVSNCLFSFSLFSFCFASGLPWWLSDKESACNAGDPGSIPGLGRSPGEGHGNPLQYSCLENPKDGGAWWATIHEVAESQTRLKRLSSSSSSGGGKQPARQCRRHKRCRLIRGLGRSPGEGHGNLLQYSSLKNPMDRGVLWATAHRTAKSQTCLEQLGTHTP